VKSREIQRKFELTPVPGHPRLSILMAIESAYATNRPSNFGRVSHRFRDIVG